jgi:hypothetical protein
MMLTENSDNSCLPNFFIVGAPKCGTTSMALWLAEHPNSFFCSPKEPAYFATDYGYRVVKEEEEYQRLFFAASPNAHVRAEASTCYLHSRCAVTNILSVLPKAKFLVMLRSPVEMAQSLHGQELYSLNEDISDFGLAWLAQDQRSRGLQIPKRCRDSILLQYFERCCVGSQLNRLLLSALPEQVKVVFLEDVRQQEEATLGSILDFAQLDAAALWPFPTKNVAKRHKSFFLKKALHSFDSIKNKFSLRGGSGLLSPLHKFVGSPNPRQGLAPDLVSKLFDAFRQEIDLVESIVGRIPDNWRAK